ncbi:unnamed protein product, partial [Choristocarpus tenellus]
CPSACSGRGYCTDSKTETCTCFEGWTGGDCSLRLCPSSFAWVDYATANDTAHASYTECSNMGICDRSTGICTCRAGFTGEACQRLECPSDCNGRGRCMSMREAAVTIDGDKLFYDAEYEEWDADMIHGCVCDSGWEGYDCSMRSCPTGVDPYPTAVGVDEEQLMDCTCPSTCSGTLLLSFMGHTTRPIPYDASAELLKYRLEELFTVEEVSVNFSESKSILCDSGGTTTSITFLLQHGSLFNMTHDISSLSSTGGLPYLEIFTKGHNSILSPYISSKEGTKVVEECSGRGYCNRLSGHCLCYSKFLSSNGKGGPGSLGDCGYYDASDPPTNCTSALPLWGRTSAMCSGVGGCNATDFHCNCTSSYSGGACELKSCEVGVAWFEEATSNTTGRSGGAVQCSGAGVCDESSGECTCWKGAFGGDACELMDCPSCGDHGECHNMSDFAAMARVNGEVQGFSYSLWDADKIRSCMCNRSLAVDNSLSGTSDTYRGPYSYSDTDWFGYDCNLGRCPTGDNRFTSGVTDIQRVNCTGHVGVFTLTFRDSTTEELTYGILASQLEIALESIP